MDNQQKGPAGGQVGYSLVELIISSVLLSMMIYVVTSLALSGGQAQEYSRRLVRVTEITQSILDDMRLELVSSVRLFGNDAEGTANQAIFDISSGPAPLGDIRLPTVSVNETIRPDTVGNEITGNTLFFTALAWTDRFQCTSSNEYLVDVYRWVGYYLTPEEGGPDPSHPIGINIVRVTSEPLVDGNAIDSITDPTDQAEVLLHLLNATADSYGETHEEAELVWMRGELPSVTGTIRQINSVGVLSDTPLLPRTAPFTVQTSASNIHGLLSYRHHSIASNYAMPSFGVGAYGITSLSGDGFPHGFEVQVVGPSAARQVLLHMVCSSTRRTGHFAWSDMQVSVDIRDL